METMPSTTYLWSPFTRGIQLLIDFAVNLFSVDGDLDTIKDSDIPTSPCSYDHSLREYYAISDMAGTVTFTCWVHQSNFSISRKSDSREITVAFVGKGLKIIRTYKIQYKDQQIEYVISVLDIPKGSEGVLVSSGELKEYQGVHFTSPELTQFNSNCELLVHPSVSN